MLLAEVSSRADLVIADVSFNYLTLSYKKNTQNTPFASEEDRRQTLRPLVRIISEQTLFINFKMHWVAFVSLP